MQLVEIRRYPVKSLLGEVVEVAAVDARGLVGDRLWAIRDADGKFGSGKNTRRFRRMPGLFDLRAYFDAVNALDPSVVPGGASILRSAGPHLSGGAGADHMTGSSATNDAVTVQVAGSDSAGDGAGGPGVESGSASGEVGVRVVGSASAGGIGAVAGSSEVPVPGIGSGPAGGGAGVPAVGSALAGGAAAVVGSALAGGAAAVVGAALAGGAAAVVGAASAGGAAAVVGSALAGGAAAVVGSALAGGAAAVEGSALTGGAGALAGSSGDGGAVSVVGVSLGGGGVVVPVVELPDGRRFAADDPAGHRAVSEHLGRAVTLVPEAAVAHHDEGPVSLITTAGLRAVTAMAGAEAGGASVDPLRFRANLLVDLPGTGFPEDDWAGRRLRIGGDVVLRVVRPLTRCVMIDMAQEQAPERKDLLKTLAEHNDMTFGVFAVVERAGRLTTGDTATWL